mgnify:CR=1 FL=1
MRPFLALCLVVVTGCTAVAAHRLDERLGPPDARLLRQGIEGARGEHGARYALERGQIGVDFHIG